MTTPPTDPNRDLDALRELWQLQMARLDAVVRHETWLVRDRLAMQLAASRRQAHWQQGAAVAMLVLLALWLGSFCAAEHAAPRFLLPGVALLAATVGGIIVTVRQVVVTRTLTADVPVVTLQRQLEALTLERLRATVVALVLGPLLWLPVLVVLLRGVAGVDLYAFADGAWIVANLALGLFVIVLAVLLTRQYRRTPTRWPRLRGLLALLAGDTSADVQRVLDELAALERPGAPPS